MEDTAIEKYDILICSILHKYTKNQFTWAPNGLVAKKKKTPTQTKPEEWTQLSVHNEPVIDLHAVHKALTNRLQNRLLWTSCGMKHNFVDD